MPDTPDLAQMLYDALKASASSTSLIGGCQEISDDDGKLTDIDGCVDLARAAELFAAAIKAKEER